MANIRKKFKGKLFLSFSILYAKWAVKTEIWMDIRRKSKRSIWLPVRSLTPLYHRYVAKIIFTYILGYKVDVGHMEAVNLISSTKYSEKQIVS